MCTGLAVVAAGVGGVVTLASGQSTTTSLKLRASEADGELRFNKKTLRAETGRVKVTLTNPSANRLPHAVEIEGKGIEKKSRTVRPGKRASVTVTLRRRGTYEFYCPVGNHKEAGMEGKLIVR
jgi:uncharacterized cupredoxin-like copper-binding protein